MSTSATVSLNNLVFFQSHDGSPEDIIPKLNGIYAVVKAKEVRNPDFSFAEIFKIEMEKEDFQCSEVNGFPSDYDYEIDNDGNIKEVE